MVIRIVTKLEFTKNIKILFAVEHGDFLHGMRRDKSDMILACIFVRKQDEYFTINSRDEEFYRFSTVMEDARVECIELGWFLKQLHLGEIDQFEQYTSHLCYYGNRNNLIAEIEVDDMCLRSLASRYKMKAWTLYSDTISITGSCQISLLLPMIRLTLNSLFIETYERLPPHSFTKLISELNLPPEVESPIERYLAGYHSSYETTIHINDPLHDFLRRIIFKSDMETKHNIFEEDKYTPIFNKLYREAIYKYNSQGAK